MRSRRMSLTPMARSRGSTAVSMNARNFGSASRSFVSGLGTRASATIRALARSAVISDVTASSKRASSWSGSGMAADRGRSAGGRAAGNRMPRRSSLARM